MFSKALTCSYPEPDKSSPRSAILLRFHLNIIIQTTSMSSNGLFLQNWAPNPRVQFSFLTCATCPAHIILLDLIAQIIRHLVFATPSSAWSLGYNPEDGVASSSETLVPINLYKRRHVPEEWNLHQYQYEDPKCLGIVQLHVFQSA